MPEQVEQTLYHGSATPNITRLEPRKRYTPVGSDVPPRIYASKNPAFAAAHVFPWGSNEGFDLDVQNGKVILCVPQLHADRLRQPVTIYILKNKGFTLTSEEETGETFHCEVPVEPLERQHFASVTEAVEFYGGRVDIKDDVQAS